jgi:hypothetical protein
LSWICSCCPCGGCSGETYWSEWHNDPPYCHDPCNCHGDWIGPGCPSCGPGCGACNGPCDGGCVGARTNTGHPAPAYARTNNMNGGTARSANSNQQFAARSANQTNQTRIASRPTNNGQQNRPIQW